MSRPLLRRIDARPASGCTESAVERPKSRATRDHRALADSLLDIAAHVDAAECAKKRAIIDARAGDCESVGKWEMRVASGDATPEAEERWNDRVNALAAWLLSEWEREQAERAGELR